MISALTPPNAVPAFPAPDSAYKARLHPWCIIRLLPKCQRITVGRFRKRNDAEAHKRTLTQLIPQAQFIVLFDAPKSPEKTIKPSEIKAEKAFNQGSVIQRRVLDEQL